MVKMKAVPELQDHQVPERRPIERGLVESMPYGKFFQGFLPEIPQLNAAVAQHEIMHHLVENFICPEPDWYQQSKAMLFLGFGSLIKCLRRSPQRYAVQRTLTSC